MLKLPFSFLLTFCAVNSVCGALGVPRLVSYPWVAKGSPGRRPFIAVRRTASRFIRAKTDVLQGIPFFPEEGAKKLENAQNWKFFVYF